MPAAGDSTQEAVIGEYMARPRVWSKRTDVLACEIRMTDLLNVDWEMPSHHRCRSKSAITTCNRFDYVNKHY